MFTPLLSCCLLVLILCFQSSCAYVIDSDESRNNLLSQDVDWSLPASFDRHVRTTKFPRIGRAAYDDDDELVALLDVNASGEEGDDELKSLEQRSVLFPRIGKRAFHNLLWANSRSNPHRMIDSQGRYYVNGYDYHVHQSPSNSMTRHRGKRNLAL